MNNVLHPADVRVACWGNTELPPLVVAQALAAPVGNVERRSGKDEVGLEVRMAIVVKRVVAGDLAIDAANGEGLLLPAPFAISPASHRRFEYG
jgi:hypothetical protein